MMAFLSTDQRLDFRIDVDFVLNKYVNGRPHICRATNMSRCGLQVHRVFEPKNRERTVGLQFQLPGTERVITCAGRVVHDDVSGETHGVEFTDVSPEQQALIDEFILARLDWSDMQ